MNWISVKGKLPSEWISVLGYMPDAKPFPIVRECYLAGDSFFCPALQSYVSVTHWAEMPEPPKEEECDYEERLHEAISWFEYNAANAVDALIASKNDRTTEALEKEIDALDCAIEVLKQKYEEEA